MNKEEEFKSAVKDLLNEPHYSYDAANWDAASEVLDKEDSKRKKRFLLLLFACLGFGLLTTAYFLFSPAGTKNTSNYSAKNTGKIIPQRKIEGHLDNDRTRQNTEAHLPLHKNNEVAGANANSKLSQILAIYPSETISEAKVQITPNTQKETSNTNAKAISGPSEQSYSATALATKTIPVSWPDGEVKLQSEKKSTPNSEEVNVVPITSYVVDSNRERTNSEERKAKEDQPVADPLDKIEITKLEGNAREPELRNIKDTATSGSPEAQLPDTAANLGSAPKLTNPTKTNYCYIEAGTYFNFGWKTLGMREGMSLNPYAGFSFLSMVSNKAAFSIGAYYSSVSNLKLGMKTIKTPKIVYGEEYDVIAITPSTINYLLVPLRIHYLLNEKQAITVGYTIGYRLDVQSKVETYSERLEMQVDKTTYKTGGYIEGFRTFNSQINFGYRVLLRRNLWLNAEVMCGLSDIRDNTFFGINKAERTTGLKISITYDLLKK